MSRYLPSSVVPVKPGPGQESVWDYPRPPALQASTRSVIVRLGGVVVARTTGAYRVLETSHPPTWYIPPSDVVAGALAPSSMRSTNCEWKGAATYWDVIGGGVTAPGAAWSYDSPTPRFVHLAGYLAFSPSRTECEIDGESVTPQEGGFYEGWITSDVVGPFKGIPGSYGW